MSATPHHTQNTNTPHKRCHATVCRQTWQRFFHSMPHRKRNHTCFGIAQKNLYGNRQAPHPIASRHHQAHQTYAFTKQNVWFRPAKGMVSPCKTVHFAKQLTHNHLQTNKNTSPQHKLSAPNNARRARKRHSQAKPNTAQTASAISLADSKKLLEMHPQASSQTGKVTPKGLKPLTFRTGI